MESECGIRKAEKADLPAVLKLLSALEDDGRSLSIEEAEAAYAKMGLYPDYRLYVAEVGGEVVGCFELLIMDNLAHRGEPSAVVEDVAVRTDLRSRGIGAAMMRFAMEEARQAGCYKLTLSSALHRERAHQFYDKLGFERHGFSFLVKLAEEKA